MEVRVRLSSAIPCQNGYVSIQDHFWKYHAHSHALTPNHGSTHQNRGTESDDTTRYARQLSRRITQIWAWEGSIYWPYSFNKALYGTKSGFCSANAARHYAIMGTVNEKNLCDDDDPTCPAPLAQQQTHTQILAYANEYPTVFLPSHDPEAHKRLINRTPIRPHHLVEQQS